MHHSELLSALQDSESTVRLQALKQINENTSQGVFSYVISLLSDKNEKVQAAAVFALRHHFLPEAETALVRLLASDTVSVKVAAVFTLGEWMQPNLAHHLYSFLKAESAILRSRSAEALGKISNPESIPPLYEALENEEELKVALRLADSLMALGDTRVISVLIAALEYDDNDIRNRAVDTLIKYPHIDVIPELIGVLKGDVQAARAASVYVLGKIGGLNIAVMNAALSDSVRAVRSGIAKALGEIGEGAAVEGLLIALGDEDRRVRTRAAQALGKLNAGEAILPLENALSQDLSRRVRWRAVEALHLLGATSTSHTLTQSLTDEDSSVRLECLKALAEWKITAAVDDIIVCLEDPIRRVRCGAARALGELGDYRALGPLRDVLWQDEQESVRLECTRALGNLRMYLRETAEALLQLEEQAVLSLSDVLQDSSERVRSEAIKELVEANASDAAEALIEILDDEDATLRTEAIQALGQLQNPVAVNPLLNMLADSDSQVRNATVNSLVALSFQGVSEAFVQELITGLQSQDMRLRTGCSLVLSQIGEGVVELLAPYLYHENERLRSSIAFVLGEIADGRALSHLMNALEDPVARVRTAAAESVEKIASAAISPLVQALGNQDDPRVKSRSIQAIGRILKHVRPALEQTNLNDPDEKMRDLAELALQGSDESIELVL